MPSYDLWMPIQQCSVNTCHTESTQRINISTEGRVQGLHGNKTQLFSRTPRSALVPHGGNEGSAEVDCSLDCCKNDSRSFTQMLKPILFGFHKDMMVK